MTFYLKYRPQTLEELDQQAPRLQLQKLVEKGEDMPHAILLSGPKGTGKTSAARILAKIVNCENPTKKGEPCNKCDMCKSITRGENIDVIELDAASHRGIEDIRLIRDAVKLSPARARRKVYIIDEAHMLTTEASNALLKTLEEPPSHVLFILATTNPEKLIGTVRSRSTNIFFKKATIEELASSLEKIAKGEGVKTDKGVFEIVAGASDGSFRDASKIFEQLVAETTDFTLQNVEKLITNKRIFDLNDFIAFLEKKETKKAILIIENAIQSGAQVKDLTSSIIERLRLLLLSKVGIISDSKSNLNEVDLVRLIKSFSDAYTKIFNSYIDQLPVELAIIEYCGNRLEEVGKKKEENNIPEKKEEDHPNVSVDNSIKPEKSETSEHPDISSVVHSNGEPFKTEIWSQVLAMLRPSHASTEALLRAAKPLDYDGSVLRLGVYYKFHKEHLESNSHRTILEETLENFLGGKVKVVCILTEPPKVPARNNDSNYANTGGGVLLTEPGIDSKVSNSTLTSESGEDIISIAEKIFNN